MTDSIDRRGFFTRLVRALILDPRVFDEVEADPQALLQAGVVVIVAGLARGVFGLAAGGGPGVVTAVAGALVLWLLATGILTSVGVRWVHGTTDFLEMLRTLGFAAAPLWFLAPAFFVEGVAYTAASAIAHAWAIAAAVVAVRQALDVDTPRALLVCGLSLAVAIGLLLVLGVSSGR